jgi:hypothetical protein
MNGVAPAEGTGRAGFRLFRCRGGCFHLSCPNQVTLHLSHAQLLVLLDALEQLLRPQEGEPDSPRASAHEPQRHRTIWLWPSDTVALRLQPDEAVALCELLRTGRAVLDEVPEQEWHSRSIL